MTIGTKDFLVVFDVAKENKANSPNTMCLVSNCTDNCAKRRCTVVKLYSTVICLQLYHVVPTKYSEVVTHCVTQCVTLVTLLSHWLQLCEEQSHVTGDGRALAPKRQKPQKTGNHAAAGDRNPTGELDRNQTEITEIHQKSL